MDSKKNGPNPSSGKKPFEVPLYVSPAKQAARGQSVELPPVQAPSLEDLAVTVPTPEGFTVDEVRPLV